MEEVNRSLFLEKMEEIEDLENIRFNELMINEQDAEKEIKSTKQIIGKTCDICNKNYNNIIDMQEFLHIRFTGGIMKIWKYLSNGRLTDGMGNIIEVRKELNGFIRYEDYETKR